MNEFFAKEVSKLLLLPIKELCNKTFVIGSYQRGYKWGKKEILELLNDINSFDETQGLYCLQPLILKALTEDKQTVVIAEHNYSINLVNEVVDGQQRSTTLYLLLKFLHHKNLIENNLLFEVDFQTRERSGIFLKEHLHHIFDFSFDLISDIELTDQKYQDLKNINQHWSVFVKDHPGFDNVDVYHFFTVGAYIMRWFEVYLSDELQSRRFIEKLLENVKVIWYSLEHSQKDDQVIQVFLNNNKGRIGLTSSELIKALFVLDIKNTHPESISNLQINQFATEWDSVEKQLQDDRFWYFIQSDEKKYLQGTRIDYLFDLLLQKPKDVDDLFAYRHFENLYNTQKGILNFWDGIMQLFYKLLNWFEDSEIFHFVGFLTNTKIKNLTQLLIEQGGKNKEELKEGLKQLIVVEFKKTKKTEEGKDFFIYAIENLHYKNFYQETLKILLLYNILYYLDNMAGHKFPFELFVKEKWSIEHIVPQNPKDIEDIEVYYQWFTDVIAYGDIDVDATIIEKIKDYENTEELKKNKDLKAQLDQIVTESEDVTHELNNLLLLDRNTNSALGNKLFDAKRNQILKFNEDGYNDKGKPVFIPSETLNAFNKTFSKEINIKNWTKEDGDNYVAGIQKRLVYFIPKAKSTDEKI